MADQLQLNVKLEDLMDPFTLDWLEEPITLPCCGRAVSRDPLKLWQEKSNVCPCCKQNLGAFNASNAPKSVNLSYLVEQAIAENLQKPEIKPIEPLKWVARIHRLCTNNGLNPTTIGRLELSTSDKKYNFKTLLIPVIDRSGSMSGSPTVQVKYSLNRIVDLIYDNSQLITNFVTYDDMYSVIELNTSVPIESHRQTIASIPPGGGTAFGAAFTGIIKVIEKYKDMPEISSIVIIFLTDGEDCIPKEKRVNSVSNLKDKLEKIWTKKYVVHSVGFGGQHDADFLNALRKIGTVEGAYRYADPSENPDSLSGKINSLLDVIGESSAIPLKLVPTDSTPPIISGENDKYWLNLTGTNPIHPLELKLSVNNEEPITVQAEYAEDENDSKIWELWYTQLVDDIASELLLLSNQKEDTLDKQFHCELLEQRARAISARIDSTGLNANRLEKLMETLKTIRVGGQVNVLKLNDLKYEGQYQTKLSKDLPSDPMTPFKSNLYITSSYSPSKPKTWSIIDKKKERRCNARDGSKEWLKVLGTYGTYATCQWVRSNASSYCNDIDENGSDMLMVASMLGKIDVVRELLGTGLFDVSRTNDEGYGALDLAVIYGYWITSGILIEHGATPSCGGDLLIRTCISNGYYNTAALLVKSKFTIVTDDMVDNAPTTEAISWLAARSQKEISIETAILKGMYDTVDEKLDTINRISWKPYLSIFDEPTVDHCRVVDLLLRNGKADPDELFEMMDEGEKVITWPLFSACKRGRLQMFNVLMKYTKQPIDRQNHNGTTILWIACCNKHTDIVGELLNMGANPNLGNLKGDSPLIPACQKGHDTIVDMLLEAGARLDCYNKNRDNPVLICCRTGQSKILDRLLKTLKGNDLQVMLNTYAEIDGFVPLLAAAELDKVECIKVCHRYGADLETRARDDNQMIPGGTALHLACFYGRVSATKCLIDLGANIKSQSAVHGYTPLHWAIKQGHINVVRYLLTLPNIRDCMEIEDMEGRIPSFYAKQNGNEQMLDEFFTNKLAMCMGKLLYADPEMEKKCSNVLVRYGQSLGAYDYNEITKININDGSTILTYALLNGNDHLIQALQHMGANFNQIDDYGVSPQFWAQYLGYNIPGLKPDMLTLEMIDRVKTVAKKSMQNKMLTGLQQGGHQVIEYQPTVTNALIKMSDGYGGKVSNNVLATLKSSAFMDHSLLGFVDKLKSKKEFPDGEDILRYLVWDAKINIIKRIASGETSLQPVHLLALYLYTSNEFVFRQVNQTLLNWQKNSLWQNFINCLYQSISLIEPFEHEVYRAVDTRFNMQDYAVGNKISWSTFSITSKSWKTCSDLINQKRGIVFIIRSKTGRDISKYSAFQQNEEIMFLPGTEFEITNHFSPSITCLGQANIRHSTYKIKESDYHKALTGTGSIIIELTEVNTLECKQTLTIEEVM